MCQRSERVTSVGSTAQADQAARFSSSSSTGFEPVEPAWNPGSDEPALENVRGCDLWIVDALRWTPHPTHAHVDKTLDWIARSGVRRAVLTNLHLDLDYAALRAVVPDNVEVGYDGWSARL